MQQADITVKDVDGSTDLVYAAIVPAAGDSSPAVWRFLAAGKPSTHADTLEISSKDNVPKTARRVTANFVHPVVQTVDGREVVTDKIPFTISGPSIMGVDPVENERAVKRFFNLLADPNVQAQFISGYAAR